MDTQHHTLDVLTVEDLAVKQRNFEMAKGHEKGWYEVKMTGKLPERRSYHCSCIYNDALYIFGGQDLKEGTYNSVWKLPLKLIMEGGTSNWEQVHPSGSVPPPIAHHNGVLYKDNWYFFGGIIRAESNKKMYCLNFPTLKWSIIDTTNGPKERDDHSACPSPDRSIMYIFGGYVDGDKSNELWQYEFETNQWTVIDKGDEVSGMLSNKQ